MAMAVGIVLGAALAGVLAAAPAAGAVPAAATIAPMHGGSATAVTSNYRVTVSAVSPVVSGLTAKIADVSGTLEVTWTGAGTVVVQGYEGEPYLRLTPTGIERNVRSPATYLNQNRYARVTVPALADATAAPDWQRISTAHTIAWHDHRTHWMDVAVPAAVRADESVAHVIFPNWQVPVSVDGTPATIVGRLVWIPPPSGAPWLIAGVVATILLLGLLFTRWWRPGVVVAAALGTVVFTTDGFGFLVRSHRGALPWIWAIGWPLVAIGATVGLAIQVRRRRDQLPITMVVAGLVVGVVGGIDRIDGVTNSQIFSVLPDWAARVAAVTALSIGAALVLRFLADVALTLATGRRPLVPGAAGSTGTALPPTATGTP
ncbi:MAG: hypothetical protein ABIR68_08020 [Ilumatobacteraceae bacterium]